MGNRTGHGCVRWLRWFAIWMIFWGFIRDLAWLAPALTLGYIASAILLLLVGVQAIHSRATRTNDPGLVEARQRRILSRSHGWRFRVSQALRWPGYTLRAPRNFLVPEVRWSAIHRQPLPASYRLRMIMNPVDELIYGTTALWFVAILFHYDIGGNDGLFWYLKVVAGLVLVIVVGRHAGYLVGSPNLTERVRQGFGSPVKWFLLIAAVDYLVLVTCLYWLSGNRFGSVDAARPGVVAAGRALLTKPDPLLIWQEKAHLSGLSDYLRLAVGSLFYFSIVKAVTSYKSFKRTDDDRHMLTIHALAQGRTAEAAEQLQRVTTPTPQTIYLRAGLALAEARPDESWRMIRLLPELNDGEYSDTAALVQLGTLLQSTLISWPALEAFLRSIRREGYPEVALYPALGPALVQAIKGPLQEDWFRSGLDNDYQIFTARHLVPETSGDEAAVTMLVELRADNAADEAFRCLAVVATLMRLHQPAMSDDVEAAVASYLEHCRRVMPDIEDPSWLALVASLALTHAMAAPEGSRLTGLLLDTRTSANDLGEQRLHAQGATEADIATYRQYQSTLLAPKRSQPTDSSAV